MKQMMLNEWIEKEGAATVAKLLKITEGAVRHWRRGWVLPDSRQMAKIRKFSHGQVSIDLTLDSHFSAQNKKNRYSK